MCSFDELSRQLRKQDAVLLGWNRRADEVVDFEDASFDRVSRTSSDRSENPVVGSLDNSVPASITSVKGGADAARGDANLPRRRKPRVHKGSSLHCLQRPASSASLRKFQEFVHPWIVAFCPCTVGPQPKRRLCINPIEKSERVRFRPDDELIILLRCVSLLKFLLIVTTTFAPAFIACDLMHTSVLVAV